MNKKLMDDGLLKYVNCQEFSAMGQLVIERLPMYKRWRFEF